MAGTGERGHPCGPGVDGGVRGVYRRLWHREAGAPAICGLLRVKGGVGVEGLVRGCSASTGSGRPCEVRVVLCLWFSEGS